MSLRRRRRRSSEAGFIRSLVRSVELHTFFSLFFFFFLGFGEFTQLETVLSCAKEKKKSNVNGHGAIGQMERSLSKHSLYTSRSRVIPFRGGGGEIEVTTHVVSC